MCGIAGFSGDFSPELLVQMGEKIAHRGPDDSGTKLFQGETYQVGLAHRRLSIIDLSAQGKQPMTVQCEVCGQGRIWLSFNGEIYNFPELREELLSRGHRFHSHTDSEVLIHLYAQEGPTKFLKRLNGIFALALFDDRDRGQSEGMKKGDLLLARDGLGIKPLYLIEHAKGVLFSSEMKSLFEFRDIPGDVDPVAIDGYLAYLWSPAPHTPLKAIQKVKPGEYFLVRSGRVRVRGIFYDLPYEAETKSPKSEKEYCEELRDVLSRAVERQMIADVPIGAFLSGGLDSSSIVAMMKKLRPDQKIPCYTISFKQKGTEGFAEDLPYARRVAKHLDVPLHEIEIEPDVVGMLSRMIYSLDEPQADPAPLNVFLIAEQARKDGLKVLMSGAGGDDIFSGYRRHFALSQEKYWNWMPQGMKRTVSRSAREIQGGGWGAGLQSHALIRRMVKLFSNVDQDEKERLVSFFLWTSTEQRKKLYGPAMSGLEGDSALELLTHSLSHVNPETSRLNQMLYLEGKHFLADHNLNYTDKMSMASAVEVRVPLLDLELVEFAAKVPDKLKQRGRVGKYLFKRAMEPLLPHDVIYRPKTGFGAPLREWLRGDLKPVVHDILSPKRVRERGLFSEKGVSELIRLNEGGRVDASYSVFSLMCIELWFQLFVDGKGARV